MRSLYSLIYSGVHQDFSVNHLKWKTFAACSLRGKPPVMITSLYYLHCKPISLLPNISIFLEKVMYNSLIEFAEKFEILHYCQFGFRKKSLDITWVNSLNKPNFFLNRDQHETTAGVFLDFYLFWFSSCPRNPNGQSISPHNDNLGKYYF